MPVAQRESREHERGPTPPDTQVDEIAHELERYVASHHAAADTVDGIARCGSRGLRRRP